MKRNGMCPICYVKQLFSKRSDITDVFTDTKYNNGVAKTPPMGWSSWNTFRNKINEDLIYETALAMKNKGLIDAGYNYINLDDNWLSSLRDDNGDLQGDLTNFVSGMPTLVSKCNKLNLKVGAYTSNGLLTCEDLPASLGNERRDAYTLAKWGIEYFKYDYCHNVPYSSYAPQIYGISIAKVNSKKVTNILCEKAKLYGTAKFMADKHVDGNKKVTGLDKNYGAMEFENVAVDETADYVLTINIRKKGNYEKYLLVTINDVNNYEIKFPKQKFFNYTARFQIVVNLKAGTNKIRIFNPIGSRADSTMLQYRLMGRMLKEATKKVSIENNCIEKPIVYSICEWGRNKPWKWGATAGNLWRTTADIRPWWWRIMQIYNKTVKLYNFSGVGSYNDPDMLEVGNGNLTQNENIAHFSLWCMMNSPLILGNDLREITDNILKIVTNKKMIAINQDLLCKQAKRIKRGSINILAKPLNDGSTAVCLFNKSKYIKKVLLKFNNLVDDKYINFTKAKSYKIEEIWAEKTFEVSDNIATKLEGHSVKVYIIKLNE